MDDGETEQAVETRSLWTRFWQFPLVAMALALGLIALCGAALSFAVGAGAFDALDPQWRETVVFLVLAALGVIAYKLVIRKLGAKKHDDLPFNLQAAKDTVAGFAGGAALITICVAMAALAGAYQLLGWGSFSDWPMIVLVTGVYASVFEELLLRGIVFRWLEEFAGSWIALVLSSLIFGFGHAGNDNATFFSSLAIAIEAGILLGAAYMLTRSLWLAIGLHAGWNVVQGMWDVPVSGYEMDGLAEATLAGPPLLAGGGFGLEATIFALIVATSAGLWLLWKAARAERIVKPMWRRKGEAITAY